MINGYFQSYVKLSLPTICLNLFFTNNIAKADGHHKETLSLHTPQLSASRGGELQATERNLRLRSASVKCQGILINVFAFMWKIGQFQSFQ